MNTTYSQNDYRNYLEHSWGKKPEQKAAEKAYNQKYYQEHKSKWAEYRKKAAEKIGLTQRDDLKRAEESKEFWDKTADRVEQEQRILYDEADSKMGEAGYLNEVAQEYYKTKKNNPWANQRAREYSTLAINKQNASENARKKADDKQRHVDKTRRYQNRATNNLTKVREEYSKTPLGKVEGAVSKGKSFISNLIKKK